MTLGLLGPEVLWGMRMRRLIDGLPRAVPLLLLGLMFVFVTLIVVQVTGYPPFSGDDVEKRGSGDQVFVTLLTGLIASSVAVAVLFVSIAQWRTAAMKLKADLIKLRLDAVTNFDHGIADALGHLHVSAAQRLDKARMEVTAMFSHDLGQRVTEIRKKVLRVKTLLEEMKDQTLDDDMRRNKGLEKEQAGNFINDEGKRVREELMRILSVAT